MITKIRLRSIAPLLLGLLGAYAIIAWVSAESVIAPPSPQAEPGEEAAVPPPQPLPASVALEVPFTPQAPFANWDETHQEICEEASVLIAMAYVRDEPAGLINPSEAERRLQALIRWQNEHFGFFKDTNAAQTAEIIRGYYGHSGVRVEPTVTSEAIKRELARGNLVILPAAGRRLGNPHFTPPGPWYHMLVVTGYRDGEFITNDPGIRQGRGWRYREDILLAAVHDWAGSKERIEEGPRAMIVVEKAS